MTMYVLLYPKIQAVKLEKALAHLIFMALQTIDCIIYLQNDALLGQPQDKIISINLKEAAIERIMFLN